MPELSLFDPEPEPRFCFVCEHTTTTTICTKECLTERPTS